VPHSASCSCDCCEVQGHPVLGLQCAYSLTAPTSQSTASRCGSKCKKHASDKILSATAADEMDTERFCFFECQPKPTIDKTLLLKPGDTCMHIPKFQDTDMDANLRDAKDALATKKNQEDWLKAELAKIKKMNTPGAGAGTGPSEAEGTSPCAARCPKGVCEGPADASKPVCQDCARCNEGLAPLAAGAATATATLTNAGAGAGAGADNAAAGAGALTNAATPTATNEAEFPEGRSPCAARCPEGVCDGPADASKPVCQDCARCNEGLAPLAAGAGALLTIKSRFLVSKRKHIEVSAVAISGRVVDGAVDPKAVAPPPPLV